MKKILAVLMAVMMLAVCLPAVAAADGLLVLDELQAPGKKAMPGKAFLSGSRR